MIVAPPTSIRPEIIEGRRSGVSRDNSTYRG